MRLLSRSLGSKLGIDMDQHTVGGLALAGVTGYGVAVIQVRVLARVERDAPAAIHL